MTNARGGKVLPPPQALVASWEGHTQSGEGLRNLVKKMAPASRQQVNLYIILNINRIYKSGVKLVN